jgi:hypothetical protein
MPDCTVEGPAAATSGDPYPDLDRFLRVVKSRWTKDLATDVDFFDVRVAYDAGGNVLSLDDRVHAGFDVKATNDGLHRLARAEEGTLVSGSITSRTRDELWTLTQTGNFAVTRLDLDGDGQLRSSSRARAYCDAATESNRLGGGAARGAATAPIS